jgi:hypothetical protein
MIHLSRSTLSVAAAVVVGVLAILAGCWVSHAPATPPTVTRTPGTAQGLTPTATAIVITVRPVTPTPVLPTPNVAIPTRTRQPVPVEYSTMTYTPNPSTLITPSPQVLPATGEAPNPNLFVPLLACGVAWILIGLVMLWARKPKG